MLEAMSEILAGRCFEIELRITRPDGSIRWIRNRGFPIRNEMGAISRCCGMCEDITERRAADAELRKLSRAVEQSSAFIVITVRAQPNGAGLAIISVADNGIGIPAENLTRIFAHGFTTRKHGHGFGLHSSALAASEMGGALRVQSDGHGCGATFTIELPLSPKR